MCRSVSFVHHKRLFNLRRAQVAQSFLHELGLRYESYRSFWLSSFCFPSCVGGCCCRSPGGLFLGLQPLRRCGSIPAFSAYGSFCFERARSAVRRRAIDGRSICSAFCTRSIGAARSAGSGICTHARSGCAGCCSPVRSRSRRAARCCSAPSSASGADGCTRSHRHRRCAHGSAAQRGREKD